MKPLGGIPCFDGGKRLPWYLYKNNRKNSDFYAFIPSHVRTNQLKDKIMMYSNISIRGYDLLGDAGRDGVRFAWQYNNRRELLESAAFPQHRRGVTDNICGYTTSVSMGCALRSLNSPCKFCRTGTLLPFSDILSSYDIAKQNVFMVLADIRCSEHTELGQMPREFAYMGQGEPGYSYPQIREAIKTTNLVMKEIGQKVHRHIVSTSGIPEMVAAYKNDMINGYFDERVTLHFSLHATTHRALIMPIEKKYPFKLILASMSDIVDITDEKPCIGILLFNKYSPDNNDYVYSNDLPQVIDILSHIDPERFRLSFCEFNDSHEVGSSGEYNQETALSILEYAHSKGFEAKLFSSYGKEKATACGMLDGRKPGNQPSSQWQSIEKETEHLVNYAFEKLHTIN